MGTVRTADGTYVHEFRHRDEPSTGKREYRRVPAQEIPILNKPAPKATRDLEPDYGGAFDGFSVSSDADGGL